MMDLRKEILNKIHLGVRTEFFEANKKNMEFLADDIEQIIQDVIKEVTPERMGEGLQPQYSQGMNRAIDHIEAKAKKLLGGEE